MRWDGLRAGADSATLFGDDVVVRTVDTPRFRGITFYEVRARSVINRVPDASRMPFRWTVNPYRGCSHACIYCFARQTHTYLEFDAGADFDSRIVVKVNAGERLRRELAAPTWGGEHIAMGTNVDCYQRAEGRYRLMREIIPALTHAANPFSILTKGALILRDLDLLRDAAAVTDVAASVSVGSVDRALWRSVEPGTPSPGTRLRVVRELTEAGVGCGVLMAPILPFLSDSPGQLDATVRAIAESGARSVTPLVLHLRPGAREWYFGWLRREHPGLVGDYEELYGERAYAPRSYQDDVTDQVRVLAARHGLAGAGAATSRIARAVPSRPADAAVGPPSGADDPSRPHRQPGEQLRLL